MPLEPREMIDAFLYVANLAREQLASPHGPHELLPAPHKYSQDSEYSA